VFSWPAVLGRSAAYRVDGIGGRHAGAGAAVRWRDGEDVHRLRDVLQGDGQHERPKKLQVDLFTPDDDHFECCAVATNMALAPPASTRSLAAGGAQEKTIAELKGEVPPAYFPKKSIQRILSSPKRANQKPPVLHRQVYGSPLFHLGLGGQGPRNPQSETVTPRLNLRPHRGSARRIYKGYTGLSPGSDRRRLANVTAEPRVALNASAPAVC
jgi:hypothetical protein